MGDDPKTERNGSEPANLPELLAAYPELKEQVEALVEKRLARDRRVRGDAEGRLRELERDLEHAQAQAAQLDGAKSEVERRKKENAELAEKAGAWRQRYAHTLASRHIAEQLEKSGVVRGARDLLVNYVLTNGQVELGDDQTVNITIGSKPLNEALPKLLEERQDILQAPSGGGAGSGGSKPTTSGAGRPVTMDTIRQLREQGRLAEQMSDPEFARQAHATLVQQFGGAGGSPLFAKE